MFEAPFHIFFCARAHLIAPSVRAFSIRKKNVSFLRKTHCPYIFIYTYIFPLEKKKKEDDNARFCLFLFSLRLTVRVMCTKLKLRSAHFFGREMCVCVGFVHVVFPLSRHFPRFCLRREKTRTMIFEREQTNPAIG